MVNSAPMGRGTTKWWRGYSGLSIHTNGWNITLPAVPALPSVGGESSQSANDTHDESFNSAFVEHLESFDDIFNHKYNIKKFLVLEL